MYENAFFNLSSRIIKKLILAKPRYNEVIKH